MVSIKNTLNVAVYKFFDFPGDLQQTRERFVERCRQLDLRGSIILAPEGMNGFVAGSSEAVEDFKVFAREHTEQDDLWFKESWSERKPFRKMKVKLKPHIIPFRTESKATHRVHAPSISPQELKSWLDSDRDFTLLDTRNAYEVRVGAFTSAKDFGIRFFSDLVEKTKTLSESEKNKPVVMYCTGGIRCEKAAPYFMEQGFREVYQLQGGILSYFEQVGGAHFRGDCYVFDRRVAVRPDLSPSDAVECFNCGNPVTREEQADYRYVYEQSCPYCYE